MSADPEFKPYVPDEARIPEFTWAPLVMGTLLGIVFGASSIYLVLKVGLTVSASIPVAVLSLTFFRALGAFGIRPATILENNTAQTAGCAGLRLMRWNACKAFLKIGHSLHRVPSSIPIGRTVSVIMRSAIRLRLRLQHGLAIASIMYYKRAM